MKKTFILLLNAILPFAMHTYAQCESNQNEMDAIKAKYEAKFKVIQEEGNEIGSTAPDPDNPVEGMAKVDFDIIMKEQSFSLDLVSVTMKDKRMSLDLPQVKMELKSIKFDEIYTKMVLKKTGQYPEIHCKPRWIYVGGIKTKGAPKCKTVWKDIMTEVPEIHTRTKEIKTDIPIVTMKTTEMVTAIPEFKKVRKDIKMNLPGIIVKNISVEAKKMEERTEDLQEQSQELVADQKKEFASAIAGNFECQKNALLAKRAETVDHFATAFKEIDLSIEQIRSIGGDPANIKSTDGTMIDLFKLKKDLATQEEAALASIDNAITELNKQEKETIDQYFAES